MDERFQRCLTREPSYLVSLRSSWDSSRAVFDWHPCGRRSPLCCSWSLCLVAGSRRKRMDPERRCRSSCPSRLSRPHLWSWHGRNYSCHRTKQKSWWTEASIPSHSRRVSYPSSQCYEGSWQGSSARWRHLWLWACQGDFKKEVIFLQFVSTTHPQCHILLLGKASGALAAIVLVHWSS